MKNAAAKRLFMDVPLRSRICPNNMKLIMIVALVADGDNPVKNAYIHKKISVNIGRNFDIFIHTSGVRSTYNNDHIIPVCSPLTASI